MSKDYLCNGSQVIFNENYHFEKKSLNLPEKEEKYQCRFCFDYELLFGCMTS